jgi:RNA polymerase sigma factor (sigma-70 family)
MAADLQIPPDDDLLTTDDAEAFGMFYDRHVRTVLGYFARRTGDPEVAADLTAETFASALAARSRYRPGGAPAGAWLFAIAARRLADYHRRGRVEAKAQKALAIERGPLGAEDAEMIRMLGEDSAASMLSTLPADQRTAVRWYVVDERDYGEIATDQQVSEQAVRQRVSRGLSALRSRMGGRR